MKDARTLLLRFYNYAMDEFDGQLREESIEMFIETLDEPSEPVYSDTDCGYMSEPVESQEWLTEEVQE